MGSSHEAQGQEVQLNLMTDGNQELGCCQARTQLCSLWQAGARLSSFLTSLQPGLFYFPLKIASP